MSEESRVIRGAPRYIRGAAAGPAEVITLIPEAVLRPDGQRAEPVAVIELQPDGVHRHMIAAPARGGMARLALTALLVPLLATLLDRWWQARHHAGLHR
jgi:hypothetical protein